MLDLGEGEHAVLVLYFALLIIGGNIGLPIALATSLLSKNVPKRRVTYTNMIISWIMFSTSRLLVLYASQDLDNPGFNICLAQATLNYACTIMVTIASLVLIVELFYELCDKSIKSHSPLMHFSILLSPWVAFVIVAIACMFIGTSQPEVVASNLIFYCGFKLPVFYYTIATIALSVLCLIIFFEVFFHLDGIGRNSISLFTRGILVAVFVRLRRNLRSFRGRKYRSWRLFLRGIVLTGYTIFALPLVALVGVTRTMAFPFAFTATLPLVAFLTLGTQKEHLQVWFSPCIRRLGRAMSPSKLEPLTLSSDPPRSHHQSPNCGVDACSFEVNCDMARYMPLDVEKTLPPIPPCAHLR